MVKTFITLIVVIVVGDGRGERGLVYLLGR